MHRGGETTRLHKRFSPKGSGDPRSPDTLTPCEPRPSSVPWRSSPHALKRRPRRHPGVLLMVVPQRHLAHHRAERTRPPCPVTRAYRRSARVVRAHVGCPLRNADALPGRLVISTATSQTDSALPKVASPPVNPVPDQPVVGPGSPARDTAPPTIATACAPRMLIVLLGAEIARSTWTMA